MLGKGSVRHNSREFMASNIDNERTQHNIVYCNTPIKDVYREMFDDAVQRYNAKQTRSDRCIDDYYEKIRTGKQEKLFYEVIIQIGNKDDMSAVSDDGKLAAKTLDEFMRGFQERNPNLRVFSAHLHMDEATPHLHVDFVPFITGSKRGLDTRVSLKQALASQGFHGGTRGDTEWNQWVKSGKDQLSQIMERHGIEWEQLGTHNEHLSVMDYKKEQRAKEVATLEATVSEKRDEISFLIEKKVSVKNDLNDTVSKIETTQDKLKAVRETARLVASNARQYDDNPEYELPAPRPLMSAKTYHETIALPLVRKLKDVIRSILLQLLERTRDLKAALDRTNRQMFSLNERVMKLEPENERLRSVESDYNRVRRVLGGERVDDLVKEAKEHEIEARKPKIRRERNYTR